MPVNQMDGIYSDYPQLAAAAQLHHREGLRRLDRAPARAFPRPLTQVTHEHVDRHGGPPRAAEVSARKSARPGKGAGQSEAGRLAAGAAAQEISRLRSPPPSRSASRPRCSTPSPRKCCRPTCASRASLKSATFPPAATSPASFALPDGAKYYQFLIKRTTTTDLTAGRRFTRSAWTK